MSFFPVSSHNTSLQNGGLSEIFYGENCSCSKRPEYETEDSVTKGGENGSVSIKKIIVYSSDIFHSSSSEYRHGE